jgi:hypothetical protein
MSTSLTFSQNHVDLANIYWRTSPFNNIEGTDYKRNLNTFGADVKLPIVFTNKNVLIFGLDYQQSEISFADFDWKKQPRFQFASSTVQVGFEHHWNKRSKMLFMGMGRLNTDYRHIQLNHFQVGGLALGTTKRSESFEWKYGAYANSEFFGPMLVPLFGFNWKINDHWRLKAVIPVNLELSYQSDNGFRSGLKFDGVNGSYRFDSSIGTDAYIDKADNNIWLFGEKKLGKYLWIHTKAGHSILRKYRIYDPNEKLALKLGPVNIGDTRPTTYSLMENGWSFELRLIFRMPTN